MPMFRAAVDQAAAEQRRLAQTEEDFAAARQAAAQEAEEQGTELATPRRPPALVPNSAPAWQMLMADPEIQMLMKARQCRLMKVCASQKSSRDKPGHFPS